MRAVVGLLLRVEKSVLSARIHMDQDLGVRGTDPVDAIYRYELVGIAIVHDRRAARGERQVRRDVAAVEIDLGIKFKLRCGDPCPCAAGTESGDCHPPARPQWSSAGIDVSQNLRLGQGTVTPDASGRALRSEGVTSVVVTHRPSLIAHVDKILVLEAGRVQQFGPASEVMKAMQRQAHAMVGDKAA